MTARRRRRRPASPGRTPAKVRPRPVWVRCPDSVLPSLLAEIPVLLALLCFCPTLKSAEREKGSSDSAPNVLTLALLLATDVHVNFCPAGPVTEANGATEFYPRSHLVYTRQETDLHQTRRADGNPQPPEPQTPWANRTEGRCLNLLAC